MDWASCADHMKDIFDCFSVIFWLYCNILFSLADGPCDRGRANRLSVASADCLFSGLLSKEHLKLGNLMGACLGFAGTVVIITGGGQRGF